MKMFYGHQNGFISAGDLWVWLWDSLMSFIVGLLRFMA